LVAHGRHELRFAAETVKSARYAERTGHPASRVAPALQRSRIQHAGKAAASNSKTTRTSIAEPHSSIRPLNSGTSAGDERVLASTSLAEQVKPDVAATTPEIKTDEGDNGRRPEALAPVSTEGIQSPSGKEASPMVAVLMTHSDIESVSKLTGKMIAIDEEHSASNVDTRTAIVAAGGLGVQLSESQTSAMSRLVSGEVSAAVLALVSANEADGFPAIPGYRTFRIRLSPRAP